MPPSVSYPVWLIVDGAAFLPPSSILSPCGFPSFYTICIVLEVLFAINLYPWNVSALPPPSSPSKLWHWLILTPPTVCFYSPSRPSSFHLVSVWILGWQAPAGQSRICEANAQEESGANLFQGEAGSIGVEELHRPVQSQKGSPPYSFCLCSFLGGGELGSCMLSIKPEHLWGKKKVFGMSAVLTDSAGFTTRLPCLRTAAALRNTF